VKMLGCEGVSPAAARGYRIVRLVHKKENRKTNVEPVVNIQVLLDPPEAGSLPARVLVALRHCGSLTA
jgi:hypothetical protein